MASKTSAPEWSSDLVILDRHHAAVDRDGIDASNVALLCQ
jgi:hypothetical protein